MLWRKKYAIFLIILLALLLLLFCLRNFCDSSFTPYSEFNELRHEKQYQRRDMITNLTKEESQQIIQTLGIIIPETEDDITILTFAKLDSDDTWERFIVEFENISDRKALYDANNVPEKPEDLLLPIHWEQTDYNGGYKYYFCFSVTGLYPLNGYVESVSELYNNLKYSKNTS